MRRQAAVTATLLTLSAGGLAAPAGAAVHRSHRVRHAAAHARTFSFYATVIHASAKGLVVRTRGGKTLNFSAAQLSRETRTRARHKRAARHHRSAFRAHLALGGSAVPGPVAVNIIGLQPGVTVLIAETVAPDGTVTVTITLPPTAVAGQQQVSGVVTDLEDESFEMTTTAGADLRVAMAPAQLSNLNLQTCDTVNVTYHQDAGMLIADSAQVTGSSSSGDCAPTFDETGPITQVSGSSITITTSDQGPMTFSVPDPSTTDGFQNGDVVDVTYTQNSDGSLTATNVQYVEQDASGTVTSVSATSLTITDSSTGQPETFVTDPGEGLQLCTDAFTGVKTGDQIDVTYHQSAAGNVADTVDDEPGDS
ncbi:MAG: hypothetical protein JO244_03230 [Solirubrobacterales bacterium]|nr:hypothetical protein [Solirubrobacterales bacterium]